VSYVCKDRGTESCPCILMETGQCYTCSIFKTGKCDCLPGWQGVCPFAEYYQADEKIFEVKPKTFEVIERKDYSDKLKAFTLETSAGFALKCKEMGTFLMIHIQSFSLPLSVVQSHIAGGKGYVQLSFYITGPKTKRLNEACVEGSVLEVEGPFTNGLINSELFMYGKPTMVVAKGIAIMPFINQKDRIKDYLMKVYLDADKLTDEFVQDYLGDIALFTADLRRDGESIIKEVVNTDMTGTNVLFMTSPYYVNQLFKVCGGLTSKIIYPNHSNMCCGRGVCGACSFTDEYGITVKQCKCNKGIKKEA